MHFEIIICGIATESGLLLNFLMPIENANAELNFRSRYDTKDARKMSGKGP